MRKDDAMTDTQADPRWRQLADRDRAADGSFFYSVATTGVYCRPSCGARTPNPLNVAFHATTGDAEAAGFRACKRCKPGQPPSDAVARACRLIESSEETPPLAALAAAAGLSTYHFHRVFKAATGLTPRAYAAAHRGGLLRAALAEAGSVTEAIYDAGFASSGRLYAQSDALLGMTPTVWRKGGRGAAIRFAVGDCSLGSILVASSGKGVCAILLGDDPGTLVRDLQDRFPNAALTGGDEAYEALVAQVVGFVDAPAIGLDLPLDVRGTAFQQRVWTALRDIPAGVTASYSDIAAKIGAPRSVRAVAGACAANALAVAIPCPRVVRNDGALSGYRWGIDRKRRLLDSERAA